MSHGKSLKEQLTHETEQVFIQLGLPAGFGEVVDSQRPDLCQFQCNGALAAAKAAKKNPRDIAKAAADILAGKPCFATASAEGPGFINLVLKDAFLAGHLEALQKDQKLGCGFSPSKGKVVLDFGGPNVAKSMHVAHLRSSVIGDCLQRLFRFLAVQVTSDIHLGDWGTQMGMLICELQREQPGLPYFDAQAGPPFPAEPPLDIESLERLYPQASTRCKNDPAAAEAARAATYKLQEGHPGYRALWRHFVALSTRALKDDFSALDVKFDLWKGESDYHEKIPALLARLEKSGVAKRSEGALVIPLPPRGAHELPPLILEKSEGGYLYGTTDLATLEERLLEDRADEVLYVVDKRQGLHFEQLFCAAEIAGIKGKASLEHIAFGTVNGPDGKPFKTRQGGVMKLKDLIQMVTDEAGKRMQEIGLAKEYSEQERAGIARMVGLAALKFADLINHRTSDYTFDPQKFTQFEGKTGPYLLYAVVRIKSILRKARERNLAPGPLMPPGEPERELALELTRFPDAVFKTAVLRAPNHLCEFAYNLAQVFSRFYQQCHILNETDAVKQASWLGYADLCRIELERTLGLLGIEVPEKM